MGSQVIRESVDSAESAVLAVFRVSVDSQAIRESMGSAEFQDLVVFQVSQASVDLVVSVALAATRVYLDLVVEVAYQ